MNQTQRKFLIDKIQSKSDLKIKALEAKIPSRPIAKNHLVHAIMSGTVELKSSDEIKEVIRQRALNASRNASIFDDRFGGSIDEIKFKISEIFIIPKEFDTRQSDYLDIESKVREEVRSIAIQTEALITRIQLASDKTLQQIVNDIDDMGNITLFDTKLKELQNKS